MQCRRQSYKLRASAGCLSRFASGCWIAVSAFLKEKWTIVDTIAANLIHLKEKHGHRSHRCGIGSRKGSPQLGNKSQFGNGRRRRLSVAARKKISEAQKRRWAAARKKTV